MNKFLTIILFLAMTGLVTAEDIIEMNVARSTKNNTTIVNELHNRGKSNYAETQGRGNNIIYNNSNIRLGNNQLQHRFSGNTPIAFDPSSNLLSVAMTTFLFEGADDAFSASILWHLRSTDNGATWDSLFVYRDLSTNNIYAPMRPSIAFTNPTKSSDINDVNTVTYGQAFYKDLGNGMAQNEMNGSGVFVYYSPEFGTVPQKGEAPLLGGNISDPQGWGDLQLYGDDELDKVFGYGTLSPVDTLTQSGYYGYYSFDFPTSEETSNNPEEWWIKHFRQTESPRTSFNGPIRVGHDKEGNLYSVSNHFFIDDDQGRYVSFSKSTDSGLNWTSFERIPRIIYSDYVAELPGNYTNWNSPGQSPYQPSELFVRDVDDFSYFSTLYFFNENDTSVARRYFIVDIRYNKGTWSINPIHELESFGTTTFSVHPTDRSNFVIEPPLDNSFGINMRMSKTADGNKLILYWIDIVPDKYRAFPPYNVYQDIRDPLSGNVSEQLAPIDTLLVTDIFGKVYDIENDTWNSTKNLTNDDELEYILNAPKIIKSTSEAILITYESDKGVTSEVSAGAPEALIEVFQGRIPFILSDVFDIDNITSVESENVLNFDVELGDAYPNPAINTNSVSISFELEEASKVSISLYNQMGNKVATVLNQFANKDFQAFNADISNLSSGTYYYQLDVQGHTFTKKLVVVK